MVKPGASRSERFTIPDQTLAIQRRASVPGLGLGFRERRLRKTWVLARA